MKWYENYDYHTNSYFWWTQRDARGVCFEIRRDGQKFKLIMCDNFASIHDSLQKAMDAAALI